MTHRRLVMASLLLALVSSAAAAAAQDARLEAAKKEGKVVWDTSLAASSSEKVAKLFETAYPGVKVEVQRTGSQRILQRMMQELASNIRNVDVVHTSDAGHYVLLKEKKLLMQYAPAGAAAPGGRGLVPPRGPRPLRAAEGERAADAVRPRRRRGLRRRLQGPRRLPLRAARHRERHRPQHQRPGRPAGPP